MVETVGRVWVLCWLLDGVSDEMGVVTNGKVFAFGEVEVQLPIFVPAGAAVLVSFGEYHGRFGRGAMSLTSSAWRRLSADKRSGRSLT